MGKESEVNSERKVLEAIKEMGVEIERSIEEKLSRFEEMMKDMQEKRKIKEEE